MARYRVTVTLDIEHADGGDTLCLVEASGLLQRSVRHVRTLTGQRVISLLRALDREHVVQPLAIPDDDDVRLAALGAVQEAVLAEQAAIRARQHR